MFIACTCVGIYIYFFLMAFDFIHGLYQLESKYKEFEGISNAQNVDFPARLLRGVLEVSLRYILYFAIHFIFSLFSLLLHPCETILLQAHLSSCPEKEKAAQERLVEPLMSLVKSYEGGRESHAHIIVQSLFEEYLSVEELFSDNIEVFCYHDA